MYSPNLTIHINLISLIPLPLILATEDSAELDPAELETLGKLLKGEASDGISQPQKRWS